MRRNTRQPRRRSVCHEVLCLAAILAGCNSAGCNSEVPPPVNPIVNSPANSLRASDAARGGPDRDGGRAATGGSSEGRNARRKDEGPAWFRDMTQASGVTFKHVSGNSPAKPFPSANGSGVGAIDYDLDGLVDLYFATGANFPLDPERREPRNALYRNRGDWRFDEVSHSSGADVVAYSAGVAVGDFDADGFPDIYVTCFGPNILLRNQGDGTFERVEKGAGVDDARWGASVAAADFNEDGLLDLYVCNYAKWTWETHPFCGDQMRRIRMHCGPRTVEPEPHVLYLNQGDGTFRDALADAGIGERRGRGQGVLAADINGDGHVDLYVGNDLNPNFLYFGRGDGTFIDATEISGAAYDAAGNEQAGMGVDVADVNQDGKLDLFVTNFQHEYNTLYENVGDGFFLDVTQRYGLVADSLPNVGWGAQFADFNLDGRLDLVVTNGHVDDNRQEIAENSSYTQPPLLYAGDVRRFRRLFESAGDYFAKDRVGRGLIVADLDNDGDVDLVVMHQDNLPALVRNERMEQASNVARATSVQLKLVGRDSNRDAIGATIVFRSKLGTITHPVKGGGSYLSAGDLRATFAVPEDADEGEVECEIRWPRGATTKLHRLRPGQRWIVFEDGRTLPAPRL